jgi:AraC-like DNA-binding protein
MLPVGSRGVLTDRATLLDFRRQRRLQGWSGVTVDEAKRPAGPEPAEFWREQLGAAFGQLVPEPVMTSRPQGKLTGVDLGRLTAHKVSGTPQLIRRTQRAVRQEPFDRFKMSVVVRGRLTVHQNGGEAVVEPGEMIIYDTSRPYDLRFDGMWTTAVIAFPRNSLGLPTHILNEALLCSLPSSVGTGAVLSSFVSEAVRQAEAIGLSAAERLGEAGLQLVAGTLSESGLRKGNAYEDAARMRVLAYIRAHLDNPQLSHATVAAAHHMGSRSLDRLFEHEPLSVTGYIRSSRLNAVRLDLKDPLLANRSIAAIAARWCFFDQAHFTRVFRAQFGTTPSAVRGSRRGRPGSTSAPPK